MTDKTEVEYDSENSESKAITKTIAIISYGNSNKKPKLYPDSIVFDVREFVQIERDIMEEHDGTSAEYQDSFTKTESNQPMYQEILKDLKSKLLPIFNSSNDENIKVYVGGEDGIHRSVAVADMLARDLKTDLTTIGIENIEEKEIEIFAEHRDIDLQKKEEESDFSHRKNKKVLNQNRTKKRDQKNNRFYGQ